MKSLLSKHSSNKLNNIYKNRYSSLALNYTLNSYNNKQYENTSPVNPKDKFYKDNKIHVDFYYSNIEDCRNNILNYWLNIEEDEVINKSNNVC